MNAYIDTSALAKCYLREERSFDVLAWADGVSPLAIGGIALVEIRCLLARRRRAGQIDATLEKRALAEFDLDLAAGNWIVCPDWSGLYTTARQLIELLPELPLRSLDAVHLAYARHWGCRVFATADRVQAEAAQTLGMPTLSFF
ncbi:MAG: type II toxin-antitoxin system VapC family toxin [Thiobacillaceae bacterium]|nr:type II toxin-antitoxin system VapC family toxin [Thiobacillaceae bacterium]MCX7672229.1 type II toxin-antitoxin system VapC family toxin [Thiobacillaceae bacterium]MDW8324497.1 type II toxin-antitoxin system VapC family toxin [Burkholderiales bacterium]